MPTKEYLWFAGLKYAEKVGPKEAYYQLMTNEFDSEGDFSKGVSDYIQHHKYMMEQSNGTKK